VALIEHPAQDEQAAKRQAPSNQASLL
jgi:hypothetical protein